MLPVAAYVSLWFSFDGVAMCYVLPVLWMTSCFLIMGSTAPATQRGNLKVTHQVAAVATAEFDTAMYTQTDLPGQL